MMPLNGASCSWLTVQSQQHLPKRVHASSGRITEFGIMAPYLGNTNLPTPGRYEKIDAGAICSKSNISALRRKNDPKEDIFLLFDKQLYRFLHRLGC